MLSWGATTMGLGGVHNYAQVTGLRFLLGVMEAGLFPGFVYYLTFWYRNSERSIRVAPDPRLGNTSWGIWWCYCLWCGPYEWRPWAFRLEMAVYHRGGPIVRVCCFGLVCVARLPGDC